MVVEVATSPSSPTGNHSIRIMSGAVIGVTDPRAGMLGIFSVCKIELVVSELAIVKLHL
jgi:hypothetical protein